MKKIDKLGRAFNLILSCIYIPFSMLSFLCMMASEAAIGATNPLYIILTDIFCVISFIIPFTCPPAILLSMFFRRKGNSVISFAIQFLPLVIFMLNIILGWVTDFIPKI